MHWQPQPTDFVAKSKLSHAPQQNTDWWNREALEASNPKGALEAANNAITLSDQYHHYIHYECAAAYCKAAELSLQAEDYSAALAFCQKATFQDHGCLTALRWQAWLLEQTGQAANIIQLFNSARHYVSQPLTVPLNWQDVAPYSSNLLTDAAYAAAIHLPADTPDTNGIANTPHPESARATVLAISNSDSAQTAISALQHWHSQYHRASATQRLNRAHIYQQLGQVELAKQDITRASDIDKDWNIPKQLLADWVANV